MGFAKTLAMELGEFGITSNTIHPGAVAGGRIDRVLRGRMEATGQSMEEVTQQALANQSVKQFIDPADIAALVLFVTGPPRPNHQWPGDPDRRGLQVHAVKRSAVEPSLTQLQLDFVVVGQSRR